MTIYFDEINPAASAEVWIFSKLEDHKMIEKKVEIFINLSFWKYLVLQIPKTKCMFCFSYQTLCILQHPI